MRILHIMAGRHTGGAETYSTDMILSLQRSGVDQVFVMSEKAPRFAEMKAAGVRLVPEVLKGPFSFFHKRRMKELIAKEKPDLIHCWMRRAASLVPSSLPIAPVPVIGWFGGYYDPRNFKACTDFVGVTEGIRDHMVSNGVSPDHAYYVQTFPTLGSARRVPKATLQTPDDAQVVLALSRLHPKKGLDTLLRAMKELDGVYVWLAGDGPLRDELEKLAHRLKMSDRVRFLGWRTDRAALLASVDVCAMPSRYEPFGTVILEAWASQVPFVACASAGPAAYVKNGEDGLLAPVDDVHALREALRLALNDKGLTEKLVANGYARYQADFTREAVTRKMLSLYSKLIKEFARDA